MTGDGYGAAAKLTVPTDPTDAAEPINAERTSGTSHRPVKPIRALETRRCRVLSAAIAQSLVVLVWPTDHP
jgi:hypothetical protein